MGHSVGDAAARSVKKSEKTKLADRTPEQIFTDIRRNLAAKLAVTPLDTAFLLAQYDAAHSDALVARAELENAKKKIEDLMQSNLEAMQGANAQLDHLKEENEQFRQVYEVENSSKSLKVEAVAPDAPIESVEA